MVGLTTKQHKQCMNIHNINNKPTAAKYILPRYACLPINHCNLPSVILGSLSFQRYPTALYIDGVKQLHKNLFTHLDSLSTHTDRAAYFLDYMTVHFRINHLEDVGLCLKKNNKRVKADYLRILRGWLFDADNREAAVLKSWVESRFGLLPRYHKGCLGDYTGDIYQHYLYERSQGLYATNALESQIDLLYSYCQYELSLKHQTHQHLTLYRGVNRIDNYEILQQQDKQHAIVLLNNLNSFTKNHDRADEFGDYILEVQIPWQKIIFYNNLLPGKFAAEEELLVIGGLYQVKISL